MGRTSSVQPTGNPTENSTSLFLKCPAVGALKFPLICLETHNDFACETYARIHLYSDGNTATLQD